MTCKVIWLNRLLKDLQVEVFDPTTIYYDNLNNIQLAKNPFSTHGPSTLRCITTSSVSVSFLVKSNFSMFRRIDRLPTSSPSPLVWTSCSNSRVTLGLHHLDVPQLRGRTVLRDRAREQERSGRDRDTESDDKFDFGSAEEAEGGSVEESESGRKKEPKPTMHGGDDAIKGEKTEDELETANSDESEN